MILFIKRRKVQIHLHLAITGLLAVGAQATLTAGTLYDFGGTANTSLAAETPTAYSLGAWTENYTGGSGTSEQIVCAVGFSTTLNTCGNPGPGSAQHISIPAFPGGTTPPGTNYLEDDGDPAYGAPISTDLTGLIVGGHYQISF